MKISFGMIVFNGDSFLKECLESIYPYAHEILIAEGPVKYYSDLGYTTSTDNTNEILNNFPDPENKIKIWHGQYIEKTHQCNEYIKMIDTDSDYIWHVDSDEIYKPEDIEKIIELLEKEKYTKVGFKTYTFFGGFDKYIGGFVENFEFIRIYKYEYGAYWKKHRPPTLTYPEEKLKNNKYINGEELDLLGIRIYHYSLVFIKQVKEKMKYYKQKVSQHMGIDNYFEDVYMKWILGNDKQKQEIEDIYKGVHEFLPEIRKDSYTKDFKIEHPNIIKNNMKTYLKIQKEEIETYLK